MKITILTRNNAEIRTVEANVLGYNPNNFEQVKGVFQQFDILFKTKAYFTLISPDTAKAKANAKA